MTFTFPYYHDGSGLPEPEETELFRQISQRRSLSELAKVAVANGVIATRVFESQPMPMERN
jgi:hypothetical protein